MKQGKVKFFDQKNNFGFIVEHETGKEYYVHKKNLVMEVAEGDEVEFQVEERKKGAVAVFVNKIG